MLPIKKVPARPDRILLMLVGIVLLLLADRLVSNRLDWPTPVERLQLNLMDTAMRLRGTRVPAGQVVIVAIDDRSFDYTGYHWPWPRAYLAEIIKFLDASGARVIGLDVLLFGADPDPQGDKALADAIAQAGNVVAVMNISRAAGTEMLELPVDPYPQVLAGMGIAGIQADKDAIIRRVQAYDYSAYDESNHLNWGLEVARLSLGLQPASQVSADRLSFAGLDIPLQDGRLLVDYSGPPGTFSYYPAFQVVLGDFPAETFKDKIVLIGSTSVTLQDVHPMPLSTQKRMPGVEVIANLVEMVLAGRFRVAAPITVDVLLLVGMALFAWLVDRRRKPGSAILIMLGAMLVLAVTWFLLITRLNWQFELASQELMLLLGISIPSFDQSIHMELERRRLQKLFGQFVAPEIISQMMNVPEASQLNKRANLTILFSDIRNFTSLSEKLSPDEVIGILNPYLEAMTSVIHRNGGTVDKYIGDAIVAFFGEPVPFPDHAVRAVRTALEMRRELEKLRQAWRRDGRFEGVFEIGIGIHTGDVFVGMIGSQQRLSYTVIGDVVNVASRLQDQTKLHGCPILLSGQVNELVTDQFVTEFVAEGLLKGKQETVRMYKVVDTV